MHDRGIVAPSEFLDNARIARFAVSRVVCAADTTLARSANRVRVEQRNAPPTVLRRISTPAL